MKRRRTVPLSLIGPAPRAGHMIGCQWIDGSLNRQEPFCGQPRSRDDAGRLLPYCVDHAKRAYLPRRLRTPSPP